MGSVSLEYLKQGFASLVQHADHAILAPFILWLDLKVAEYKVNGFMVMDDSQSTTGQGWLEMVAYFGRHTPLYNVRPPPQDDSSSTAVYHHYYNTQAVGHSGHASQGPHSRAASAGSDAPFRHTESSLSDHSSQTGVGRTRQVETPPRQGPEQGWYGSPPGPPADIKGEPIDQGYYAAERTRARSHSPPRDQSRDLVDQAQPKTLSQEEFGGVREVHGRQEYGSVLPTDLRTVSVTDTIACSTADENLGANRTPVSLSLQLPSRDEALTDPEGGFFKIKPSLAGLPIVHKQSSYRCPMCNKLFLHNSSFNRHMKLHQGVFSHICAVCGRKFTRREHFVRHKCNRRPNKPSRMLGSGEEPTSDRLAYPPSPTHSDNRIAFPQSPVHNESSHNYDHMDSVQILPSHPDGHTGLHTENLSENSKSRRKTSTPQKVGHYQEDEETPRSDHPPERLFEHTSANSSLPSYREYPHPTHLASLAAMHAEMNHGGHLAHAQLSSTEEAASLALLRFSRNGVQEASAGGLLNLSVRSASSTDNSPSSHRTQQDKFNTDHLSTERRDREFDRINIEERRSEELRDETAVRIKEEILRRQSEDMEVSEVNYRHCHGNQQDGEAPSTQENLTYSGPSSDSRLEISGLQSSTQESPPETPLSAPASLRGSPSECSKEKESTFCTVCHKTFLHHSSLNRHLKLHMGVYTHACAVCGRRFTRKEHFLQHKCSRRPKDPTRQVDNALSLVTSAQQVVFPPPSTSQSDDPNRESRSQTPGGNHPYHDPGIQPPDGSDRQPVPSAVGDQHNGHSPIANVPVSQ